jgi:hypothetical protein
VTSLASIQVSPGLARDRARPPGRRRARGRTELHVITVVLVRRGSSYSVTSSGQPEAESVTVSDGTVTVPPASQPEAAASESESA